MPLRLAFDLDGVLADMDSGLLKEAEGLFGKAMADRLLEESSEPLEVPPKPDTEDGTGDEGPAIVKLHMTTRQQRRLWRHIETVENFWQSLNEIEPGVIARLAAVAAERRWEVIFLTKRPSSGGSTAQIQTQRWLESKGFPLPSVYVVQGNRGLIAAALDLDFVIDDRPENCLEVIVDSKARAILVWRDDPKQLPAAAKRLGIGVVKTVDECLAILSQIDVPKTPENTGVIDRVMRLLGFREPAQA